MLDECQVPPRFSSRSSTLVLLYEPLCQIFHGQAAEQHAKTYVCGLLRTSERKNIESIAYRFGQSRLPLQGFIGWDAWDDAPLRQELRGQVTNALGPSRWCTGISILLGFRNPVGSRWAWPDSGVASGQSRQLSSGHLPGLCVAQGPIPGGHAAVLPKAWSQDKSRLRQAGVPKARRGYRTRHQLPWNVVRTGASLPTAGLPVTTRWGDRTGFVVACGLG